ncbi:ribosome recycling factor [Rothia nasimurium]|uniref:Ribosome recycling factor n=1 Tax=Rothia nasimurium TaxID=85336 RepID=A0A4Y9F5Y8_9MICC|nr:ribosome recycling factor [Rothia nasimurium]MBF0807349.1 ribosome recycling factor [Rothia nasimurium]TFU23863.1 ribosome recycling factor [Rothia nasimurium]
MGFDFNSAINEKAGKKVVSEENAEKAQEVAADTATKLTEKFGK